MLLNYTTRAGESSESLKSKFCLNLMYNYVISRFAKIEPWNNSVFRFNLHGVLIGDTKYYVLFFCAIIIRVWRENKIRETKKPLPVEKNVKYDVLSGFTNSERLEKKLFTANFYEIWALGVKLHLRLFYPTTFFPRSVKLILSSPKNLNSLINQTSINR